MVAGEHGFVLRATVSGVSLAGATAGVFLVRKPTAATEVTWTGSIVGEEVHYTVLPGDLVAGGYRLQAQVTLADGSVRRTKVTSFTVDPGV